VNSLVLSGAEWYLVVGESYNSNQEELIIDNTLSKCKTENNGKSEETSFK